MTDIATGDDCIHTLEFCRVPYLQPVMEKKEKRVCRAWLTNSTCSYVALCHMHESGERSWKKLDTT